MIELDIPGTALVFEGSAAEHSVSLVGAGERFRWFNVRKLPVKQIQTPPPVERVETEHQEGSRPAFIRKIMD